VFLSPSVSVSVSEEEVAADTDGLHHLLAMACTSVTSYLALFFIASWSLLCTPTYLSCAYIFWPLPLCISRPTLSFSATRDELESDGNRFVNN